LRVAPVEDLGLALPTWPASALQGVTPGLSKLFAITMALGGTQTMTAKLRVTENGVRLREQPDATSTVLSSYPAGTLVEPVTDHAWRQVSGPDGRTVWMAADYLEATQVVDESAGDAGDAPEPAPGRYLFASDTPTYRQKTSRTCSIASVIWCLRSIGFEVDPADAYDAMVGPFVDARGADGDGLLDATGAGIVAVLRSHWRVTAVNDGSASFDEVAAVAGQMPVALGLRSWGLPGGHWSPVRGFDGERLILANPAGTGPRFGQETLTEREFDARGPASMVTIAIA
jgi:hypothetical protein